LGVLSSGAISRLAYRSDAYGGLIALAFVAIVPASLWEICLGHLRVRDQALRYVCLTVGYLIVNVTCNIVFIVYMGMGVWGFVMSKVAAAGLGAAYLVPWTIRRVGLHWDREAARRMLSFGKPLILAGLAMYGLHFLDRFFLAKYATLAVIGIYALGYKFGVLITYVVGEPFERAFGARLYAYTEDESWRDRASRVLLGLFFFTALAWTGLAAAIDETLTLIAAPAFRGAAAFVPWIALAYVLRTVGDFFRIVLYVDKSSGLATRVTVTCVALNALLCFLLIPGMGAWGATWATVGTWAIYMVLMWRFAQKRQPLRLPYARMGVLCVVAAALYLASEALPEMSPLAGMFAGGGVALLYVPIVLLLRRLAARRAG
jgi:O-antigen/teichoic acid export membrane protein